MGTGATGATHAGDCRFGETTHSQSLGTVHGGGSAAQPSGQHAVKAGGDGTGGAQGTGDLQFQVSVLFHGKRMCLRAPSIAALLHAMHPAPMAPPSPHLRSWLMGVMAVSALAIVAWFVPRVAEARRRRTPAPQAHSAAGAKVYVPISPALDASAHGTGTGPSDVHKPAGKGGKDWDRDW